MNLSQKVVNQMASIEAVQSLLHPTIKRSIKEYGLEATRESLEWFLMIINKELAEEYARVHLHKLPPSA